jgi:hypothetical protein
MNKTEEELFHELSFYTLEHPVKSYFIHQHIVDAYSLQLADQNTKPISIIFSLAGLYLYLEKNYSGRQVQLAHMKMARNKKQWPHIILPENRGNISVSDVLSSTPGTERDVMIKKWCNSVWIAYSESHQTIALFVQKKLPI